MKLRSLWVAVYHSLWHQEREPLSERMRWTEPAREGALDLERFIEITTVWTFLFGIPTAFVSVIDMPGARKVVWLFAFAVCATCLTYLLNSLFNARLRLFELGRTHWIRLSLLLFCAVASIIVALVAANDVQNRVDALKPTCVAVGAGNSVYAPAFQRAYERHGGESRLGCAIGPVTSWVDGYLQTLEGAMGRSVITATAPDRAYLLESDELRGLETIAGPGQSVVVAGYPYEEVVRLPHGWKLELGAGGYQRWQRSAILKREGGDWHWVQSDLWERYSGEFGGPEGRLGYPTSDSESWENGIRQQFERGRLIYRADRGVLTQQEYIAGKSRPRPRPIIPVAPETLRVEDVYRVGGLDGISHEIPPNKRVEQRFRSKLPYISQIGVIVGLDPRNNTGGVHAIELALLDQDGGVLFSRILPMVNKRLYNGGIPTAQGSLQGHICSACRQQVSRHTWRVFEQAVKAWPHRRSGCTRLPRRRTPRSEPHYDPTMALSGVVQGRSQR